MYQPSITAKKAVYSFIRTTLAVALVAVAAYYSDAANVPVAAAPISGLVTAAAVALGNWAKWNLTADHD